MVPGLADMWLLLCDLHDSAVLDVSQRPNDRMLVAVTPTEADAGEERRLPPAYSARVRGKLDRARIEADHLYRFFARDRTCLNVRLANYFNVPVPEACCSNDRVRCSVCANAENGPGITAGTPLDALVSGGLKPAQMDPAARETRLDESVVRLLAAAFRGLTRRQLTSALAGRDREWVPARSAFVPLPRWLRDVPQFGRHPDVTAGEVDDAITRLTASGVVTQDERRIRTTANAARGPVAGRRGT